MIFEVLFSIALPCFPQYLNCSTVGRYLLLEALDSWERFVLANYSCLARNSSISYRRESSLKYIIHALMQVLVEKMLRSLPGVSTIFLLIRPLKSLSGASRWKEIERVRLFWYWKRTNRLPIPSSFRFHLKKVFSSSSHLAPSSDNIASSERALQSDSHALPRKTREDHCNWRGYHRWGLRHRWERPEYGIVHGMYMSHYSILHRNISNTTTSHYEDTWPWWISNCNCNCDISLNRAR